MIPARSPGAPRRRSRAVAREGSVIACYRHTVCFKNERLPALSGKRRAVDFEGVDDLLRDLSDDGSGMAEENAKLSVLRHARSAPPGLWLGYDRGFRRIAARRAVRSRRS